MGKKETGGTNQHKASKKGKGAASPSIKESLVIAATHKETESNSTPSLAALPPPPPQQSLFQYSENKPLSRKSSTKMQMPSKLAAAMLSLPWPPPENPKLLLAKRREAERMKLEASVADMKKQIPKKENKENDSNGNNYDDHKCCGTKSCCCGTGTTTKQVSRGQSSRKLYLKKKSQASVDVQKVPGKECCSLQHKKSLVITGDSRRKPGAPYLPVTVPPFKHVHTAWPGFDHAPVHNWKRKYLIAKPWPYHHQWRCSQQNDNTQFNGRNLDRFPVGVDTILLKAPAAQTDLLNRNFTGRSFASLRPTSSKASSTGLEIHIHDISIGESIPIQENGMPKQRIHLQRVGSCLK